MAKAISDLEIRINGNVPTISKWGIMYKSNITSDWKMIWDTFDTKEEAGRNMFGLLENNTDPNLMMTVVGITAPQMMRDKI